MILPTSYFGSIFQFALIAQLQEYKIEIHEHFIKQSFRSRTQILGANGIIKLSVPLQKWRNHTPTKEIKISYEDNWQAVHWKSIVSAYRTSPFLDFYEDEIEPLFSLREEKLIDYNQLVNNKLKSIIGIDSTNDFTDDFIEQKIDLRQIVHPKNEELKTEVDYPTYLQVFSDRFDFHSNLSILDLLFNLGPQSKTYLQQLDITKWQKK